MPFNLKEFPKQLPVTLKGKRRQKRGATHQRDETRLLVAFARSTTRQNIETILRSCGLKLEDVGEPEIREEIAHLVEASCSELKKYADKRKIFSEEVRKRVKDQVIANQCLAVPDFSRRVTHTPVRFWVRSEQVIDQEQVNQLIEKAKTADNRVRWIGPVYRSPSADGRRGVFVPLPNVVLLRPATSVDNRDLARNMNKMGLRELRRRSKYMGGDRYFVLTDKKLEDGTTVYKLMQDLRKKTKLIQNAWLENLPLLSASAGRSTPTPYKPDDTLYGSGDQWNLSRIDAEEGWGILQKEQQNGTTLHPVTICILDSDGVDLTHEEFQKTGQVVHGFTLPEEQFNSDPPGQAGQDQHGTWCAGVALATTGNHKGIAGLAGLTRQDGSPIFSLMPMRVGQTPAGLRAGLEYAVAHADVISINMNHLVTRDTDGIEMDKIDKLIAKAVRGDKGIVICVSSGDDEHGDKVQYPADHPDVIACGATTYTDQRCTSGDWFSRLNGGSSYGDGLSVVAPGVSIPTTTLRTEGNYILGFEGTSASAPHVAALAALILSLNPELRPEEVRTIIEKSATRLPSYNYNGNPHKPGWNKETGFGLINVRRALETVPLAR